MKPNKFDYFLLVTSIAAVVCAVYWQSLSLPFIQDDWGFLNALRTRDALSILKLIFAYENTLFYRPLSYVYLWLMYEIWGAQPFPFHVVALIIHIVNACMVALVFNKVTRSWLISWLTALVYAAAIAIHLEPLAWTVGIYDIGGAFFFFTSIWLILRNQYTISAIFYLLGCFLKESLFPLSILLIAYSLFINFTVSSQEKTAKIHVDWKQIAPFLLATSIVLAIKLSSGVSPFDFPVTHPYAIKLFGTHLIRNGLVYVGWMVQSFVPLWPARAYTDQFYIVAVIVALLYGALSAFGLRQQKHLSRPILLLLMWLFVALLPALFLPSHTYRYYATYALPAFVGFFLFMIKESFSHFGVRSKVSAIVMISIATFAVLSSIFQSTRIYGEGLNQNTLADGTNLLIKRAALIDIVYNGLQQHVPSIPSNSVILLGNADIWSFDKDNGPQVWYNDSTVHIYALSDLKQGEDGQLYIENPVQSQGAYFIGSANGNIRLDPSRLFVFEVSNGKLNKIDIAYLTKGEFVE